jgi:TolA-binding protein
VAIFKLADTEYELGERAEKAIQAGELEDAESQERHYELAARFYNVLLKDYATMGSVTNGLFDLALYQLAQADIKVGDQQGAEAAVDRIVHEYRGSGFGERSQLLLGEDSSRKGNYDQAREMFTNLLETYPNTALRPEIQLAVARTYEQEGEWSNALGVCENWLQNTNFATNALLPEVEFARALDTGKAGMETNALEQMTNFVSQFQSNSLARGLAAQAQNWIGDYYRNHGDEEKADLAYQNVWVLFPDAGELVFQARLMAGKTAEYYDLRQASNDYSYLAENTNASAAITNEAWFQLGYTDFLQFQANRNLAGKPLLDDAITALRKVTNASPSNPLAPQALGQLGNCWLAWAPLQTVPEDKTNAFKTAAQMFQAELDLPQADVTARSQAEYGLGLVEQGLNHPDEALAHYLRVVDDDSEKPDPAWVKEAGVAAVRLYEEQKEWAKAVRVYARVKAVVPTIGGSLRPPSDSGIVPP